jgi:hypothetical protein
MLGAIVYDHERATSPSTIHELVRDAGNRLGLAKRQPGRLADRQVGELAGVKLQRPVSCQAGATIGDVKSWRTKRTAWRLTP